MSDNQNTQLQTVEPQAITFEMARSRYDALKQVVETVLVEGEDYGTVPGITEPFLKKPGAQKLMAHFNLRPDPQLMAHHEDWERGIFFYRYRVTIFDQAGNPVGACEAACTNQEDKFKFRWEDEDPPEDKADEIEMKAAKTHRWKKIDGKWYWQRKVETGNPFDSVNNVIRRSQKRATSGAVENTFAASGFFAKEGKKAKDKEQQEKKAAGANEFWKRVRETGIRQEDAKPIADQAIAKKITWKQAIEQLPK